MSEDKDFNLDSLLDGTLDDLEDLPEFKPFPQGTHRCTVKFEKKEINKHPAYEVKLKALETVELTNPSDTPLEEGAETSIAYMLDNEFGRGNFKKLMKFFAESISGNSISELVENSNNSECLVVTGIRKNKNNPDQQYTSIVNLQVV